MHRWRLWRSATIACTVAVVGCAAPATTESPVGRPSATPTPSSTLREPSVEPSRSAPPSQAALDPLAWRQVEASGPAAREDHTWTVAGAGATAFLFGGRDGLDVFGDLWAFDLASDTWSMVETSDGPAPRFGHEATWVDGIGLVIFAGQSGPDFFNDLWAFEPDTGTWRQLPSGGEVPVARYGTCAAIGPDGRLWISHGFTADGTRFADTKAYDFADGTWTDETPSGDLPVNRCLHGCWWTSEGELALFGGQTTGVTGLDDRWVLRANEGWTQVTGEQPGPRNLYARARIDAATLLFGGQALDGSRLADAWLLVDGMADALRLDTGEVAPPGRSGSEMIVDAKGGRMLLFGGLGADGALGDTWELIGDLPTGE